jgi:hypothetical protein
MAAHMATGGLQWDGAPDFGTVGYVAVTADEIAIVRGKTGLFKPKVGSEVIARAPRSDIASGELDPGALKAALRLRFADGGHWEFALDHVQPRVADRDEDAAFHGAIVR